MLALSLSSVPFTVHPILQNWLKFSDQPAYPIDFIIRPLTWFIPPKVLSCNSSSFAQQEDSLHLSLHSSTLQPIVYRSKHALNARPLCFGVLGSHWSKSRTSSYAVCKNCQYTAENWCLSLMHTHSCIQWMLINPPHFKVLILCTVMLV